MKTEKIKALLVSTADNIFYLSGWKFNPTEREGWILVTDTTVHIFTDSRFEGLYSLPSGFSFGMLTPEKRMSQHLEELLKNKLIETVHFEAENISYLEYELLAKLPFSFTPLHYFILETRSIKDQEEYMYIKKACELIDQCLAEIIPTISIGLTEKDIARKIEHWCQNHDVSLAFPTIVAIDGHASIPHYEAGDEKIKKGSFILIDCGISYNGYNSDITRMVSIGKPSEEIVTVYKKMLEIQEQTIELLGQKETYNEVDTYCRTELENANVPLYRHALGHGIGLSVHELPRVSYLSKGTIEEGHMITIEPGVYKTNEYGIRIEDTVYIGKNKKPEILTKFSKKIQVVK